MAELCKVLIVDDEILVRQGLRHHLNWEQEGFVIIGEASNGEEALRMVEQLQPHIVITDIVMPVMDGEEFTRIVKADYPEVEVVVLSSFGEFDYVRSTFQSGVADYILKPKLEARELLEVLRRTAERIPALQLAAPGEGSGPAKIEQVIDKLLSGYEADADPVMLKEAFPYNSFCLIGVDVKRLSAGDKGAGTRLREKISGELAGYSERMAWQPLPQDGGLIGYLINLDRGGLSEVKHMVKSAAALTAEREPGLCWLVSDAFTDLRELQHVYTESFKKLAGYRFFYPKQTVLIHSELRAPGEADIRFNLNLFTDEMKRGHYDSAFAYLQAHVKALAGNHTVDVFEFKSLLGNLIFNITVLLGNLEVDTKELEEAKYSYLRGIEEADDAETATGLLTAFIGQVENCLSARQQNAGPSGMKKLLDYIAEHYSEPLTLTEVAKHFHFNPSYLSSYFAAHNKEGFNEYVNRLRIGRAEELLRAQEPMISEISGLVGYSDHSYFCKVFKKFTGLSPSQYRKQHLGQREERGL
ncbi:DNA-binding response regulator [Paenibacillus sambharensis]|uniref:DNA-binding response regulator n=1 Tax=Paenibacillus sambharensis TaxID=1803190 RepID=A0A2W1L913_9BACL|nr:response regulator transcription factor [Paenibacillus sambharensis]PZD96678.1 DNA-binding response regulator [Paenibacillus sambharensis]